MALKFGPQWLRDLTDVGGTGSIQPPAPSFGVKFKLADYRYGREEMLALYSDNYTPPDPVRKHHAIFSKDNQRPISMTPFSEDEQRLMSQGINSHVVLRGGGRGGAAGGGASDRGRGRGRGRGDGYVSRQNENGDQPFGRQMSNDGWEQVGRKNDRSFSRGYDEQVPPAKREFLRSSSNNWRDKKLEASPVAAAAAAEEEEESGGGSGSGGMGAHWRQNRDGTTSRWGSGSARPNWRQAKAEEDENRPSKYKDPDSDLRGPRRTSDSYDSEVPEWAGDDIGDDPGTFDSKGIFVPRTFSGTKESHSHQTKRTHNEAQNTRKKLDTRDEIENHDSDKPTVMNEKMKGRRNIRDDSQHEISTRSKRPEKSLDDPDAVKKQEVPDYVAHSIKGDGDSIHAGLMYSEKNTNGPQAPPGSAGGMQQDSLYHHPHQSVPPENPTHTDHLGRGGGVNNMPDPDNENLLRMEKSLQNLLAGMTANVDPKTEEEADVSKGALPLTHKDANMWFYRDPQGQVQGPFSSESMAEWFRIGYFTMNLIVKRGCDDSFKQLGELIKQYGRVPFVPGPPLPPLITSTSVPEDVIPAAPVPSTPEIPATHPSLMTMPSMVNPMVPGMMGHTMPSLHDRFMFRSMMLQQEYLKQQLMMQQLQMQTMAKLQEQESFKDYSPDQQHDIAMRMMMQTNPLLMQQMQQLQHQQVLLQQQQQQQLQSDLHSAQVPMNLDGGSAGVLPDPFQHPMSLPSMPNMHMTSAAQAPIPSTTTVPGSNHPSHPHPVSEKDAAGGGGAPVWPNNNNNPQQHTENSIWSQPQSMWDIDNETSQAYKIQLEKMRREREEEKLKEEERLQQELLESKQEELRKQQNELERQRQQMRREKEQLDKERLRKLEEVRRDEEHRTHLDQERQKKERTEQEKRMREEKKRQDDERKKRDQEMKKQEEKRRKEEEKLMFEEQKKNEAARRQKELEEMQRRQEMESAEAQRKAELQRQMELQQIQEEEERMARENVEKEKQQQALKKQHLESQRQQESLRKLQEAQKEQLANIQLPASSNWARQTSQGGAGHSKSLTEIQEEEARRERGKQKEQQAQKERMLQEQQAAFLQQQQLQIQNQKSWAAQASKGIANRGLSLLDIQQQEKENAKRADKEKGKSQNHQAKPSLGSSSNTGLWGTNSTWESSSAMRAPAPASTGGGGGGIWDMGVPQSVKKPQLGKNGLAGAQNPILQQQQQQQQQPKKNAKTNKKAAAPPAKQQKEVETVQKLFHNKKQDGFSSWVTEKLSSFSSDIDVPTFVSFIVDVDSPDDVRDYVKTYLGDTSQTQEFSRKFLEKRNQHKNQMRLQKQLEEDSIWGPAPAVNPHTATNNVSSDPSKTGTIESGGGGQGGGTKSKNKKKKKAQKLDGSILGFTVGADPNRKNATGEFETIN